MRSGSKRLLIGLGTFIIAAAMVAPSFAAKKAVTDDELDTVTAAGQPVVINATGAATVSFLGFTSIAQDIQASSQQTLRALILNNVIGENQVHNGLNISAMGGQGPQTNTITQSWGSIDDYAATTSPNVIVTVPPSPCSGALICKSTGQFVSIAGTVRVLSRAADQIIVTGGSSTISYNPFTAIAQDISDSSQNGLVALVVNNVAGLNQVATGINIQGSGQLIMDTGSLQVGGGGGNNLGQTNNINQFRGTPINFR